MKRCAVLPEHLNNLKLISEWQFGEILPRSAGTGELMIWLPPASTWNGSWNGTWKPSQAIQEVQVHPGNS